MMARRGGRTAAAEEKAAAAEPPDAVGRRDAIAADNAAKFRTRRIMDRIVELVVGRRFPDRTHPPITTKTFHSI